MMRAGPTLMGLQGKACEHLQSRQNPGATTIGDDQTQDDDGHQWRFTRARTQAQNDRTFQLYSISQKGADEMKTLNIDGIPQTQNPFTSFLDVLWKYCGCGCSNTVSFSLHLAACCFLTTTTKKQPKHFSGSKSNS